MRPWFALNIASSMTSTLLRAGMGIASQPVADQPAQLLELYEFEGCPHCRLVREVLTELDLDALIKPCPKAGDRFRPVVVERGGKAQFPYLVDPNTGAALYESADIIAYLFQTYANSRVPWRWQALELQRLSSVLASLPRLGAGVQVRPGQAAEQPLELFSFESSPFARPVRDLLCELQLPYILRSMGRTQAQDWLPPAFRAGQTNLTYSGGTRNRQRLQAEAGQVSVPYLIDPNTGRALGESSDIVAYLHHTYAS